MPLSPAAMKRDHPGGAQYVESVEVRVDVAEEYRLADAVRDMDISDRKTREARSRHGEYTFE